MSRPQRPPHSYRPGEIIEALRNGKTLKQLALTDRGFPYPSRLAMHMVECGSDEFYEGRETIRMKTNPVDNAEMWAGFTTIERWELFRYDAKRRRYKRNYDPGETEEDFKRRVRQKIDAELATFWRLADITGPSDTPAPQSYAELGDEIGRSPPVVVRCVKVILAVGYMVGYDRGSTRSLWVRPDSAHVIYNQDNDYDRIGEADRRFSTKSGARAALQRRHAKSSLNIIRVPH